MAEGKPPADKPATDKPADSAAPATTKARQSGGEKAAAPPPAAAEGISPQERDRRVRLGTGTGGSTDEMAAELDKLGVDVRLDNRVGRQRPRQAPFLKPQQYDGPEVGYYATHDAEHRDAFLSATGQGELAGEPLGMRNTGLAPGDGARDPEVRVAPTAEPEPVEGTPHADLTENEK